MPVPELTYILTFEVANRFYPPAFAALHRLNDIRSILKDRMTAASPSVAGLILKVDVVDKSTSESFRRVINSPFVFVAYRLSLFVHIMR